MKSLRQTRAHHQQTNRDQDTIDPTAEAEDLVEVVEDLVEAVVEATVTTTATTTTIMATEGPARRFYLTRYQIYPQNLLQVHCGNVKAKEKDPKTKWAIKSGK